jgi:hypothetical protein
MGLGHILLLKACCMAAIIEYSLCGHGSIFPVLSLRRPMSLTSFIARNAKNCGQMPGG